MNDITIQNKVKPSALALMAERMNVPAEKLFETLKQTCFKGASDAEMLALVVVANSHGLSPLLKEIYAFPGRGGIVPVVSVDGWNNLMNRSPNFDGIEFSYEQTNDGKPISCTATIFLKDRSHPVKVTEFYDECFRNTEPWKGMPRRMLRHKALIQASRVAFGFGGIYDEDEARDIVRDEVLKEALPSNCERVSDRRSEKATPAVSVEVLPKSETAQEHPKDEPQPDPEAPKSAKAFAACQVFIEESGIPEIFVMECLRLGKLTEAKTLAECPAGLLEQLAGDALQTRILKRWNSSQKKEGAK